MLTVRQRQQAVRVWAMRFWPPFTSSGSAGPSVFGASMEGQWWPASRAKETRLRRVWGGHERPCHRVRGEVGWEQTAWWALGAGRRTLGDQAGLGGGSLCGGEQGDSEGEGVEDLTAPDQTIVRSMGFVGALGQTQAPLANGTAQRQQVRLTSAPVVWRAFTWQITAEASSRPPSAVERYGA